MTGVGCLTIGWLIGQQQSKGDRERLAYYDATLRLREERRIRRQNYLDDQQMLFDGESIRDGDICVHEECEDEEFELMDYSGDTPKPFPRIASSPNGEVENG